MTNADAFSNAEVPEHLLIRDFTPADDQQIADIYNQSLQARDASMDLLPKEAKYFAGLREAFSDRETILVLERNQKIIGWGVIKQYSDRIGYQSTCETSVYLQRELTGRGYGTTLKKAVIERCRQYGYHHLVAKIFAQNIGSIKYNQRLGYEIVGTQREVGYINGRWQDIVIMQLILDNVIPS
jgi:L-amino acid N-acyltransferase